MDFMEGVRDFRVVGDPLILEPKAYWAINIIKHCTCASKIAEKLSSGINLKLCYPTQFLHSASLRVIIMCICGFNSRPHGDAQLKVSIRLSL